MNRKLSKEDLLGLLSQPIAEHRISLVTDVDPLFDVLGRRFPTLGNSIDWKKVPGAVSAGELWLEDAGEKFSQFVSMLVKKESLSGPAYVLCDSTDNVAFSGDLAQLLPYLHLIADLAENTYVISGPDVAWCAHLSFEGWMDFGFTPIQ